MNMYMYMIETIRESPHIQKDCLISTSLTECCLIRTLTSRSRYRCIAVLEGYTCMIGSTQESPHTPQDCLISMSLSACCLIGMQTMRSKNRCKGTLCPLSLEVSAPALLCLPP